MDITVCSLCIILGKLAIGRDLTYAVANIPQWPQYSQEASNLVFRLPKDGSYIEVDTYRADGIDYINSIPR